MRFIKLSIYAIVFVVFMTSILFAEEAFFPRRPDISNDGSIVAFSFQGDIWTVSAQGGEAKRLTANPAYDRDPVFSPDGTKIAFASNRFDQYDVFVMPVSGGLPERLTFAPTGDIPRDWSIDGNDILFSARRVFKYPVRSQIQTIPVTGGTAFRLTDFFAQEVTINPDGKSYLLAIGDNRFGRTGYRGTLQSDIWHWTPGTDPVQVTSHPGYDTDPMWGADGKNCYWRGEDDETGAFNIWRKVIGSDEKTRLTNFNEEGVRSARISRDGSRIVFEAGTDLYVLDTSDGVEPVKLSIEVAADQFENPVVTKNFSSDADEVAVSEDGEEIALIVHGEIVLVNKELEGRATVPIPDPAREKAISFKPGGADTLLFLTDRADKKGNYYSRVAMLISDDPDESNLRLARHHKIEYLSPAGIEARNPQYSPKGDRIAYVLDKGDLYVMNAEGKKVKKLFSKWMEPGFSWSPDGKWIAYAVEDRNYNRDIWIISADGGDPVNISQHPDDDFGPVWSGSGNIIAWSTRRYSNQYDVVYAYLTRADDEKTKEEWEIWEKTRDKVKDEEEESEEENGEEEEEEFEIRIDFEDLYLRARRLTNLTGDEYVKAIHPKGDKIAFLATVKGNEDLYTVNRFGEETENLTKGGTDPDNVHLASDEETIWFIKSGKPAHVKISGGDVTTTSFRARLTIDKPARRLQILEEGWRTLGGQFYDPEMHGLDWPFIREKVRNIVSKVYHDDDFADAMNIMLRSLNASHMGYYPDGKSWASIKGFLGLEFDPDYTGNGLKVSDVIPYGPADKEVSRLLPSDIILTIDGQSVSREDNYFKALADKGSDPVLVNFKRGREELEYEILPVNWFSLRQTIYDNDTKLSREKVEEVSKDRVGYIHIQSMGWAEVENFERDLYAAADDKEALVIDVRNNGGGWTTDMLLTILTQPVHAYTIGRDGEVGYPDQERLPLQKWAKPIAVICNENSYSNAEIFSHAVKTIGRGPVVGVQTGGNVISTWGWTTLDGGHIRLPMRGWYVWGDEKNPERNNINQEHGGCIPDYIVPLGPAEYMKSTDPQLDKAIELMIDAADKEKDKPVPSPKRAAAARK